MLKAVFASDIGVDNDPISTKDGGGIWFDILNIDPARNLTFDEVKSRVTQDWTTDQTSRRLVDKAVDLTRKLDSGTAIAALATAQGNLPVKHVDKITRLNSQGLSSTLLDEVFNRAVGKAGSAEGPDGGRIIFSVASASVPPLDVKRYRFRQCPRSNEDRPQRRHDGAIRHQPRNEPEHKDQSASLAIDFRRACGSAVST